MQYQIRIIDSFIIFSSKYICNKFKQRANSNKLTKYKQLAKYLSEEETVMFKVNYGILNPIGNRFRGQKHRIESGYNIQRKNSLSLQIVD